MKNKLKIAVYSGTIPSTTFIERLIQGLGNAGNTVQIFGGLKKNLKYSNPKIQLIPYLENKVSKLLFLIRYSFLLYFFRQKEKKQLDHIIRKSNKNINLLKIRYYPILWHKPDVFHLQWAKGVHEWLWVQQFGIKLIVSLRGTHNTVSPLADVELKKNYELAFPKVDGFHAVSEAIGKEAQKYGAQAKRIKVVYSGLRPIDLSKEKEDGVLNKTPFRILSVGRAHWIKGYHYALDACALLNKKDFDFQYTIVGAKGIEELEYQKKDLELVNYVTFLDQMPYESVLNLMQQADLLLLPSVEEGIANVVLEAMQLGTMVLTTDCGGMNEVIKNKKNGFIVPVRNPQAMANTIIEISTLAKYKRDEITINARLSIGTVHSEEKMVRDMEALYHFVLDKTTAL